MANENRCGTQCGDHLLHVVFVAEDNGECDLGGGLVHIKVSLYQASAVCHKQLQCGVQLLLTHAVFQGYCRVVNYGPASKGRYSRVPREDVILPGLFSYLYRTGWRAHDGLGCQAGQYICLTGLKVGNHPSHIDTSLASGMILYSILLCKRQGSFRSSFALKSPTSSSSPSNADRPNSSWTVDRSRDPKQGVHRDIAV